MDGRRGTTGLLLLVGSRRAEGLVSELRHATLRLILGAGAHVWHCDGGRAGNSGSTPLDRRERSGERVLAPVATRGPRPSRNAGLFHEQSRRASEPGSVERLVRPTQRGPAKRSCPSMKRKSE